MSETTVAIVGGGFCGTLAAIRLLSAQPTASRIRISLIEPEAPGRGLAYRPGPAHWLLNVPAERMSAFADLPGDFLEWARQRDPAVSAEDFLPRAWYGQYLESRLERARRRSAGWATLEHVRARATDVRPTRDGARLTLDDGSTPHAARVLLALGNSPAAGAVPGVAPEHVVTKAWDPTWIERLPVDSPRVLLIGTGLTMIDIALSIAAARPGVRMLALSRRGLLPRAHAEHWPPGVTAPFPAQRTLSHGPLHERLRTLRRFLDAWSRTGGDWRTALQRVREAMPALWADLPHADRARFLRHLRTWWDVHRHRVPAQTLARIAELRSHDRLRVEAGRVLETRQGVNGRLTVSWRSRGSCSERIDSVDAIVNATGPDSDPRRSTCALVQALMARSLCRVDPLGLGWETDADGRLLDRDGQPSPAIFYAGPLLRAGFWEATAVPELRVHVDRTTTALARSLATSAQAARRVK